MTTTGRPPALEPFIEDELLRAPMVFDQLLDLVTEQAQRPRHGTTAGMHRLPDDTLLTLQRHRGPLADGYLAALKQEVMTPPDPPAAPMPGRRSDGPLQLELVDEDAIALDVEVSRVVDAIKASCEGVLRDLQAYLAAVVGDMGIAEDHNPFHPAAQARALRAAAQALPGSLQHQIAFLRAAAQPFAQLLQRTYGASCARLEDLGIEPATHRTVLLPSGTRQLQGVPGLHGSPDLRRMRDAMPTAGHGALSDERLRRPSDNDPVVAPGQGSEPRRTDGVHVGQRLTRLSSGARLPPASPAAGPATLAATDRPRGDPADTQAAELVSRLFQAFARDERIPPDVLRLIARLCGPAMQLALTDPSVLDRREHPLWTFIHRFAYQAEMVPSAEDPERQRWLHFGRQIIELLATQRTPSAVYFDEAVERLETFLQQRLARRCEALAGRMEALQKTESGLAANRAVRAGDDRPASDPPLETVPAALMPAEIPALPPGQDARSAATAWLDGLVTGEWVRLLLKGRWVHAQLLWRGERGQILLLGDGASDATWVLRRGVLLRLHAHGLAKTLKVRTLVGAAAMRVQERLAVADAA